MRMNINRRQALALTAGGAVFALTGLNSTPTLATAEDIKKAIMEFTGGKTPESGRVKLTAPEIAENGNTVPINISVASPMTESDYVQSMVLYADGNPSPFVATFHFTPMSGEAQVTTRIRLAKTQNVMVVAKMSDGSTFMDTKQVKVTIGGCGG